MADLQVAGLSTTANFGHCMSGTDAAVGAHTGPVLTIPVGAKGILLNGDGGGGDGVCAMRVQGYWEGSFSNFYTATTTFTTTGSHDWALMGVETGATYTAGAAVFTEVDLGAFLPRVWQPAVSITTDTLTFDIYFSYLF